MRNCWEGARWRGDGGGSEQGGESGREREREERMREGSGETKRR